MTPPYLLGGEAGSSFTPPPTRSFSRVIRIVLVTWVLAGTGFAFWKFAVQPANSVPSPSIPARESQREDILHHMEAVNAQLESSAKSLRRAENQLANIAASLEQDLLFVETRQLRQVATAASQAQRDIQQARQEVELVRNSLKEQNAK